MGNVFECADRELDLRNKDFLNAFKLLHANIRRTYPFTEHKGIDWDAKLAKFGPRFEGLRPDQIEGYSLLLREYVVTIPDDLVSIYPSDPTSQALWEAQYRMHLSGFLGFVATNIDSGEVVVVHVRAGSAAEKQGIKPGAILTHWDGEPIQQALQANKTWLYQQDSGVGKAVSQDRCKLLALVRGSTEDSVTCKFKNADGKELEVKLQYENIPEDDIHIFKIMQDANIAPSPKLFESCLSSYVASQGIGVIRIARFGPHLYEKLTNALTEIKNAPSLVLDLRGALGGEEWSHDTASICLSAFVTTRVPYADLEIMKFSSTGVEEVQQLEVPEPKKDKEGWSKPMVVLVDSATRDAAEVFASLLQKFKRARVFGVEGTGGAVGLAGLAGIAMPMGFVVSWPIGRFKDPNGKILLTADSNGIGGVVPDNKVSLTPAQFAAYYNGTDFVLQEAISYLQKNPINS